MARKRLCRSSVITRSGVNINRGGCVSSAEHQAMVHTLWVQTRTRQLTDLACWFLIPHPWTTLLQYRSVKLYHNQF